jgi:hypothetical protein
VSTLAATWYLNFVRCYLIYVILPSHACLILFSVTTVLVGKASFIVTEEAGTILLVSTCRTINGDVLNYGQLREVILLHGSLYIALKEVNRSAMLAGIGFLGLFVVLDLGITWSNYSTLDCAQ